MISCTIFKTYKQSPSSRQPTTISKEVNSNHCLLGNKQKEVRNKLLIFKQWTYHIIWTKLTYSLTVTYEDSSDIFLLRYSTYSVGSPYITWNEAIGNGTGHVTEYLLGVLKCFIKIKHSHAYSRIEVGDAIIDLFVHRLVFALFAEVDSYFLLLHLCYFEFEDLACHNEIFQRSNWAGLNRASWSKDTLEAQRLQTTKWGSEAHLTLTCSSWG